MEIDLHKIDFDKYTQRLSYMSEILTQVVEKREYLMRLMRVLEKLECRADIVSTFEIVEKWIRHFQEKSSKLKYEIDDLGSQVGFFSGSVFLFRFGCGLVIPTKEEMEGILYLRTKRFNVEKFLFEGKSFVYKGFEQDLLTEIINKLWNEVPLAYIKYFKNGMPIEIDDCGNVELMKNENRKALEMLGNVLGIYDFVQYLEGRKNNNMNGCAEKDLVFQNSKKVKSLLTIQAEERYREYAKLYCTSLKKYNDKKEAKKEVLKKYDIDEKTLKRALNNECNKEMLDTLKIKI